MIEKIIRHLKEDSKQFQEIRNFSTEPGIYALFFMGKSFPIEGCKPKKDEIIYIGKTERSQQSRDADTHFATGKTGSSTLRKSFGSLLHKELNLVPIPRSQSDIDKGRYAHFKFDLLSEEKLTEWMQTNLGLSFYPYPKSNSEIDSLETLLINELVPILNIDRKNLRNPYFDHIRGKRKLMSEIAYGVNKSLTEKAIKSDNKPHSIDLSNKFNNGSIHKYEDIWKQVIPSILSAIENNKSITIILSEEVFNKVGNRKSYSFNLEFENGKVTNNIDGSAVARDLARVLLNNTSFKNTINNKRFKIKMGKDFILIMQND